MNKASAKPREDAATCPHQRGGTALPADAAEGPSWGEGTRPPQPVCPRREGDKGSPEFPPQPCPGGTGGHRAPTVRGYGRAQGTPSSWRQLGSRWPLSLSLREGGPGSGLSPGNPESGRLRVRHSRGLSERTGPTRCFVQGPRGVASLVPPAHTLSLSILLYCIF